MIIMDNLVIHQSGEIEGEFHLKFAKEIVRERGSSDQLDKLVVGQMVSPGQHNATKVVRLYSYRDLYFDDVLERGSTKNKQKL